LGECGEEGLYGEIKNASLKVSIMVKWGVVLDCFKGPDGKFKMATRRDPERESGRVNTGPETEKEGT